MSLMAAIQNLNTKDTTAGNAAMSGMNLQDIKDLKSAKGAFDKINDQLKGAGLNFQNIPGFQSALDNIQQFSKPSNALSSISGLQRMNDNKNQFGAVFEKAIHYVDEKQKIAANEAKAIFTGESDNLHQAVLSMSEGRLAFNLLVEMRNQLMEGMQELSRLPVG